MRDTDGARPDAGLWRRLGNGGGRRRGFGDGVGKRAQLWWGRGIERFGVFEFVDLGGFFECFEQFEFSELGGVVLR